MCPFNDKNHTRRKCGFCAFSDLKASRKKTPRKRLGILFLYYAETLVLIARNRKTELSEFLFFVKPDISRQGGGVREISHFSSPTVYLLVRACTCSIVYLLTRSRTRLPV